jgi:hypothetical protein
VIIDRGVIAAKFMSKWDAVQFTTITLTGGNIDEREFESQRTGSGGSSGRWIN